MKRFFLFALCAALAFAACNPNTDNPGGPDAPEPIDNPEDPQADKPAPGVYNFVLPDSSGKTAWAAGDEIFVHGGYTPSGITVKLSASDISSDGKTASVNLTTVPESVYGPDDFYAAYPAGLIDMDENFCDDWCNFKDTDAPLMCAWLTDHTFNFESLSGCIKFSVDGDWDGIVFRSATWSYTKYDTFSAQANSEEQDYKGKRTGGQYFLNKDIGNGTITLYFPGLINFKQGFYIHVRKGDSYPKAYLYGEALSLKRDAVLDLGNITSGLTDYDGPAPKDLDMPKMGKSTKYDIKEIPELSGICLNADKTFLWGVGDNGCLGRIDFDGKVTKMWSKSCGMEDVTLYPETGDLYIADEDNHRVVRIDAPDYGNKITSVFKIQEAIDGKYGNSSIEGISYYKDNILFVGSQVGANLWKYTIDGERLWMVSLRELTNNAISEVGGLCYDHKNDWLWVIDSETQKMYVLDEEITHILASYPIRYAGNCESLCVDPDRNCVWVGDDSDSTSRLFKIEFEGL